MINRIVLLVLDGLGVGALPDAADYGDADANTFAHLADSVGGVTLPNLESLGLGHVAQLKGVRTMAQPNGCFGRLAFTSSGKDSVTGLWEIAGVPLRGNRIKYASGVPADIVTGLEQALGRKVLGGQVATYRSMLRDHGAEHLSKGALLLWTDGQCTCHLAAHERVMPMAQLAQRCRDARKSLSGSAAPDRIVAHVFKGAGAAFETGVDRRDVLMEPPGESLFDLLNRSGQIVMGVGKVSDLFSGRGFTRAFPAVSATAVFEETLNVFKKTPRGLLCASLDLTPDEPSEAAAAIEDFDRRLSGFFDLLRPGDAVMITGDHGRDITGPLKGPTREYAPLLITGPRLASGVNLGIRTTAADLGQTIVDALRSGRMSYGDSFFEALRPG
jgi:phosphopentomutase